MRGERHCGESGTSQQELPGKDAHDRSRGTEWTYVILPVSAGSHFEACKEFVVW